MLTDPRERQKVTAAGVSARPVSSGAWRIVLAVSTPVLAMLALAAPASAATETFNFTGGAQTWTVPAGVAEATFDVYGAQGGGDPDNIAFFPGLGGRATATIAVTPGASIQVNVGGQGRLPGGGLHGGGFNGGGGGVPAGSGGASPGGGGASDIRIGGTALTDRVLVAGGGGGAGNNTCGTPSVAGGRGGGLSGLVGGGSGCGSTGGGGTQTAGGGADPPATAGTFGVGGNGGGDASTAGGGGGGGWYGGGGGLLGSGGGGGSGHGPDGTVFETGVRPGDGLVTVTYTPTIATLIQSVVDLRLPIGVETSLLKPLIMAQERLDAGNLRRACNQLGAFIGQVQGLSGNKVPAADADDLIAEAKEVRRSLNCGPAPSCAGNKATIVGTGRADKLRGTSRDDVIVAGGGDDRVAGMRGDDLVCGSDGDDELRGNGGGDVLKGGGGGDVLRGGGGADRCGGGGGSDSKRQC
jgi:Glycine rich protein/RTX calcium-binding nonapeptide repeat (4 copies)